MRSITSSSGMDLRWLLGENSHQKFRPLGYNAACSAWDFYGIQHKTLSTIRIGFLLRLIVVDVEPFLEIWSDVFSSEDWEIRYHEWLDPLHLFY